MDTDRTPEICSRASIEQSRLPHDIRSEIAYARTGRGTLCGESPGPTAQSKVLAEEAALHRCAGTHNIGRGLYQRFAPASHRLLGVSCCGDGTSLRNHGMA